MGLEQFTNLYQLSKTLCFELIPQGDTLRHIVDNEVITNDENLSVKYMKMKTILDEYHKYFINCSLENLILLDVVDFVELYKTVKTDKSKADDFRKCKLELRKQIVNAFEKQADFSSLFNRKLFTDKLKPFIEIDCNGQRKWDESEKNEHLSYCDEFSKFTTYFTGYNTTRKNMYSEKEIETAIAYRLIDENLPKFIDNIEIFDIISASSVSDNFPKIWDDMKSCLVDEDLADLTGLADFFDISYYSYFLTQKGIDAYNSIIGGVKDDDSKKQGINEYVNLYNQKNPKVKLPLMKKLYKQILSDRDSISLPEAFTSSSELLDSVRNFAKGAKDLNEKNEKNEILDRLKKVIRELKACDLDKIYIRSDAFGTISNGIFGDYSVLTSSLELSEEDDNSNKQSYYSIHYLQNKLAKYNENLDKLDGYSDNCIADYFANRLNELTLIMQSALQAANNLLHVIDDSTPADKNHQDDNYSLTQNDKDLLKAYLDSVMSILHLLKPLHLPVDFDLPQDYIFYYKFNPLYDELEQTTKLYDKVRNFATKKPYSEEKIKLNFCNPQILNGWQEGKESDYSAMLLRKGNLYYLGIMDSVARKEFKNYQQPLSKTDVIEKMCYNQVANPSMDIPNLMVINGKTVRKTGRIVKDGEHSGENLILEQFKSDYLPENINRIRKNGSYSISNEHFSKSDLCAYIEYYMERIKEYRPQYEFNFKEPEAYQSFKEFTDDIDAQAYQVRFKQISYAYIDKLVQDGKLYLFQIYNKDFSTHSKGKPNLHTMYWKALFAEDNLRDVVYKLNGKAEIFYRKKSITKENEIRHIAGQAIEKKNPALRGQTSTFDYDLIKDRRYTIDKFQLHVPITLNFKAKDSNKVHINVSVNEYLKNNPEVNVLGIDRGERNLLYFSLIDRNGRVVKDENGKYIQYSLNTITGTYKDSNGHSVEFSTPYHELLNQKEKERDKARKSWGTIENIKELKSGYLSQVVHHIATLMVKYNAIVVMEDLNSGFKRSRFKVEKQVYQKFEKALIEKLNYLVFKDTPVNEPGGLYKALQLTKPFSGFKDMTTQCGFIFYVQAWNTSKIDPVTGFVDFLKPKYTNINNAQEFFRKFKSISYDVQNDWFCFAFDYAKFTKKADGTRTEWELCTQGELRYAYNKKLNNNHGGYEKRNITEKLKELFEEYGIDYASGSDLKDAICSMNKADFFQRLIKNLQIILAMRYSCAEDGEDFILSPVADKNGNFFCSRGRTDGWPQDADANGAFNIARKGLWVLEQIDRAENGGGLKQISNKEWLNYVQKECGNM